MSHNPRCLVFGANGFVGSHLVDELIDAGYIVRAFDRYSRPQQFNKNSNVEIYKGDFFHKPDVEAALRDVTYVFHSFSATTPFSSENDPYSDIELNLKHNVQLFEACDNTTVKKVIFISSGGAVYGHIAEKKAATEDDAPTPVSPYGICKLATEHYLAYFNRKKDLNYIVYRLSNPYGPRQLVKHSQGVVPTFLEKIARGEKLTIFGDGNASRDYIYIRDATKMMVNSFAKTNKKPIYNIGSGKQTTLDEIIGDLRSILNQEISVEYQQAPKTFLKNAGISIKRFEKEFGTLVLTDLSSGLKQTINY